MSGWRAALVAVAVGAVILAAGFVFGRDEGPSVSQPDDGGGVALACAPGLESACRVVAAELGVPYRTWSVGSGVPDRTVVVAPAADLPDGLEAGPVILRSPIVIGAWRQRALVLLSRCGALDFECVAGALGMSWSEIGGSPEWGDVKLGLADPAASEEGMLAWSAAASLADPENMALSITLVASSDGRLASDMVLFGDSRADLAITTEAALAGQMANAPGRGGRIEVFYPVSSPWVEYVAAGRGRGVSSLKERLSAPDLEPLWAAAGVRSAVHQVSTLLDGLGQPGSVDPAPDSPSRGRLLTDWKEVR